MKDLAIVSNGKTYRNINKSARVKKLEKKLRREQRCLSQKYENLKKGESTQKNIQKQKLSDRIYRCDCGYVEDRDFNFSMCLSIFEHIFEWAEMVYGYRSSYN